MREKGRGKSKGKEIQGMKGGKVSEGVRKKRGVRTVTVTWTRPYHGLK